MADVFGTKKPVSVIGSAVPAVEKRLDKAIRYDIFSDSRSNPPWSRGFGIS
jgi:hypothetical protein